MTTINVDDGCAKPAQRWVLSYFRVDERVQEHRWVSLTDSFGWVLHEDGESRAHHFSSHDEACQVRDSIDTRDYGLGTGWTSVCTRLAVDCRGNPLKTSDEP